MYRNAAQLTYPLMQLGWHYVRMGVSIYNHPGTQVRVKIAAVGQLDGLTQASFRVQYDDIFEFDEKLKTDFVYYDCANFTRDIRVKRTNTTGNISLTVLSELPGDVNMLGDDNIPVTIVVSYPVHQDFRSQT